jgi:uncharacterized membrane protein
MVAPGFEEPGKEDQPMSEQKKRPFPKRAQRFVLTGLLTAIPIIVTWFIISLLLEAIRSVGQPVLVWLAKQVEGSAPWLAAYLREPVLVVVFSVVLVVAVLYALGWTAHRVLGRRLIRRFDLVMERIPLVKKIYGSTRTLLNSLQHKPGSGQRVVLIDFPTPEMKTVGFVTRTLTDADSGRELAAVYVPTTPNPTSGYLEIVPIENVTMTNWTVDEAMTFIMSGGAVAPSQMNYDQSAKAKAEVEEESDASDEPDEEDDD